MARCCIESCPTVKGGGVPLHSFPREDPARCQVWIDFVRATRGTDSAWTPMRASRLCARHFTLDSYLSNKYVGTTMLSSTRDLPWELYPRWLRPDSVPTVNGGPPIPSVVPDHPTGTKAPRRPRSGSTNECSVERNPGPKVRSSASQTVEEASRKGRCVKMQCFVERCEKTTQSTLTTKTASVKTQTKCVKRNKNGNPAW